ncbi:hypothetical protein GpartN1_g6459.t1 [Galdieria partita]|uniref:Microsomal signal peptidase 12 kDa subunit n=1 Tax=Galdieria partita TaxID=83374 RepID=A0A9C7Q1C6_9RHOD|nr:hypothetical protein GpartN1_g6459.t1 [Galdieria partita]
MDLQGQATCERYTKKGIFLTTVACLLVALVTDDYEAMLKCFIIGVSCVGWGVLFNWPLYRRHPLHFVIDKNTIES